MGLFGKNNYSVLRLVGNADWKFVGNSKPSIGIILSLCNPIFYFFIILPFANVSSDQSLVCVATRSQTRLSPVLRRPGC